MLSLLVSVIFVCVLGSTNAACPNGFEMNGGSCYFFSHGKETWIGAFESCKLFGAMLVEVNDVNEDTYLANKSASISDASFWMGLSDKLIDGEYVWQTSMAMISADSYSNWAVGEPNNHKQENCVIFSHADNYLWKDTECYDKERYICEKSDTIIDVVG